MLVSIDGTDSNFRFARPKKYANITTEADAVNAPVALRVLPGHGGETGMRRMVSTMIRSGHFDEEVLNYSNELLAADVGIQSNNRISTTFVNNAAELQDLRNQQMEARRAAERARKADEINNDPNIGATSENVTADYLRTRMQHNE